MRCPICKGQAGSEGNPFRPFCSERCRLIDLDNWLSERYRTSTAADNREENGSGGPVKSEQGAGD